MTDEMRPRRLMAKFAILLMEKLTARLEGVTVEEVRRRSMAALGVDDYDEFVRLYVDGREPSEA